MNRIKKIVINILLFIFCFFISAILCMNIFDDIFMRISFSSIGFIAERLFLAAILYMIIKSIFAKKLGTKQLNLVFFSYVLIVMSLTLFKSRDLTVWNGYNLNPIDILNDLHSRSGLIMTIGNLLVYIPIGLYLKTTFKNKSYKFFIIIFIFYSTSIEVLQYIFKLGIFDINDIILNTIGFCFGIYLPKLFNVLRGRFYEK